MNLSEKQFLQQYNPENYERPSCTVDMLLFTIDNIVRKETKKNKKLKILLIKRKDYPFINCWALPGGFVKINENLKDAAYRQLKEETNLSENVYLEQLYTFGDIERDPRMRVISTAYMALTFNDNINKTKAGNNEQDALWFDIDLQQIGNSYTLVLFNEEKQIKISYELGINNNDLDDIYDFPLEGEKIAFDHIKEIFIALNRLRGKLFYTDIAFNLLPQKFTLTEIQQVYEIILGKTLDKSNFRKKILNMVEKTSIKNNNVAYRPANYYKLKKEEF